MSTSKLNTPPENIINKIKAFRNGKLIVDLWNPKYSKNFSKFNWIKFYTQKAKQKDEWSLFEYFNFNIQTQQIIIPIFENRDQPWHVALLDNKMYDVTSLLTTTIYDHLANDFVEFIEIPTLDLSLPKLTMVFGERDSYFYLVNVEITNQYKMLKKYSYMLDIVEQDWKNKIEEIQKLFKNEVKDRDYTISDILLNFKKWDYNSGYNWQFIHNKFFT